MKIEIDKSKCGEEYSLCPRCKFECENDYGKCSHCTMIVNVGYDYLLWGTRVTHLHKNFEPKLKGGD